MDSSNDISLSSSPSAPKAAITIPNGRRTSLLQASSLATRRSSMARSAQMMGRSGKSYDPHVLVDVESPNFKTQHPEDHNEIINSLRRTYLLDSYRRETESLLDGQDDAAVASATTDNSTGETAATTTEAMTPTIARAGGDITRDIYKLATGNDELAGKTAKSMEDVTLAMENRRRKSTASGLNVPGGFRREFIVNKVRQMQQQPTDYGATPLNSPPGSALVDPSIKGREMDKIPFLTRNFLEFLYIYGHFAGESFEDDFISDGGLPTIGAGERSALMLEEGRRVSLETSLQSVKGNTPTVTAFFLLLKSFIGTGVLFLPGAFANGGLIFSIIMLLFFGVYSYWCYFILIRAKQITGVSSFGDIGLKLYGSWMKFIILFSLVLTQIGFSGAYVIFTAENLRAFIKNVFLLSDVPISSLMLLQLFVFIPLSFIRNVSKLSLPSLLANFCVMAGLIIVLYFSGKHLIVEQHMRAAEGVIMGFNSNRWSMFVGTAIFAFEGIGLIIPVQDSMKHPEKFPLLLALVIGSSTVLFIAIASVGYLAYGRDIKTVILLNLPQQNIFVNLIQFFYSLAIMLSTPLQLFPAIKIIENKVFPKFTKIYVKREDETTDIEWRPNSGKLSWKVKWLKNFVRAIIVALVILMAYFGADKLDKFVSIIGSFACIPLVYMYPPMLHLQSYSRPKSADQKIPWGVMIDYVLIVFGGISMLYTSYESLFTK
ncbi:hypothetical protein HG537_0C03440 [Torulaspora globosa]|uniref:Amino acid transporter transmembrane domain-containing protein n=1 Tax=Torulaspora globosa TaxID=48254 RepID=A0A7H9HR85_9SACH|nr:hypothetical protein HG537_0C03440 [Torulaspora sp. CBS 2947]